jgi:beta-glucosidase-like glycosyl hydrolase
MKTFQPEPELAVAAALNAGTDNDCGKTYARIIPSALNKSIITESLLDERLSMLWKVRLRLGHFDPIGPLNKIQPNTTVCTDEATATSLQGVIQGAALLKNSRNALPLAPGAGAGTIALVGPNGNYSFGVLPHGYYGPTKLCPQTKYWTAIDALSKYPHRVMISTRNCTIGRFDWELPYLLTDVQQ